MGKLDTQATVTLIVNGEQSKTSLKEVTSAVNETRAALSSMHKEDDPVLYQEKIELLGQLRQAQADLRTEILSGGEATKGFFADFKEGFEEIEHIAAGVTIGTIISQSIRGAIEGIKELWDNAEKAYTDNEMAEASLANKIKATGDVSGETRVKLQKYQETLEAQTGIDETVIAKGEDVLLTYTNIRGKIYDQALPAVLDYTAAMNNGKVSMEGVQASAGILGKALDNVSNAKRSLREMGITLTSAEDQEIQTRRKNNDIMGAQQIILNEVNKRYGDMRNTLANLPTAPLEKMDTALEAASRRMGEWITSVKSTVAEFFLPFVKSLGEAGDEADKLTDKFNEQKDSVTGLQKNIEPLLTKYDDLMSKGKLNHGQQVELNSIINTIAGNIPTAVTQWDKYGNAMGINTTKARDFIKTQQQVLSVMNQDAISKNEDKLKDLQEQHDKVKQQLDYSTQTGRVAVNGHYNNVSEEQMATMRKAVADLQEQIDAYTATIKHLKGTDIDIPKDSTVTPPTGGLTPAEIAAAKAAAERKAKAEQEALDKQATITGDLNKLNEEELASTKSTNDKEIAAVTAKYDALIAKEKEYQQWVKENKELSPDQKTAAISTSNSKIGDVNSSKQNAVNQLKQKQAKDLADAINKFQDSQAANLSTNLDKETVKINQFYDDLRKNLSKGDIDGAVQIEANRIISTAKATSAAKLQDEIEYQKKMQELRDQDATIAGTKQLSERAKIQIKYDQELAAFKKLLNDQKISLQEYEAAVKQIKKNSDDANAKNDAAVAKQIEVAAINTAQQVSNQVFALNQQNRTTETNAQIKNLEDEKTIELSNAHLTASQKTAINTKFAQEEAAIKLKQWQADQDAAVEQAIINGALAVAKLYAEHPTGVLDPVFDEGLAGIILNTAMQVGVIESKQAPTFGKGGIISGPSHANGGIPLINGNTGQPVAEVEGNETVAVFSKETTQNNGMLINELLHNGQHRNGAPVRMNSGSAMRAMQKFGTGGILQSPGASGSSGGSGSQIDLTPLLDKLDKLHSAVQDQQVIFNTRAFDEYRTRQATIVTRATS
ncbi:hypothetical protein [Mucilaginibacter sp.]